MSGPLPLCPPMQQPFLSDGDPHGDTLRLFKLQNAEFGLAHIIPKGLFKTLKDLTCPYVIHSIRLTCHHKLFTSYQLHE